MVALRQPTEEEERKFFAKILRDTFAVSIAVTFIAELQSFRFTTVALEVAKSHRLLLALLSGGDQISMTTRN